MFTRFIVYFIDQGRPEISGSRSLLPPKGRHGTDTESNYDTAEDDILEAVVRTATAPTDKRPRERRRARNRDRKSCKYIYISIA